MELLETETNYVHDLGLVIEVEMPAFDCIFVCLFTCTGTCTCISMCDIATCTCIVIPHPYMYIDTHTDAYNVVHVHTLRAT